MLRADKSFVEADGGERNGEGEVDMGDGEGSKFPKGQRKGAGRRTASSKAPSLVEIAETPRAGVRRRAPWARSRSGQRARRLASATESGAVATK
eukprot:5062685-Pyramimonas_sp.AAC.1